MKLRLTVLSLTLAGMAYDPGDTVRVRVAVDPAD